MNYIENQLGKALGAQDVAKMLSLDVKTVRKHFQELGGIRFGRRLRFFEKEVCNAIQERNKMGRTDTEKRGEVGKSLPDEEGRDGLGEPDEKTTRRRLEKEDKHNLFG